MATLPAEYQDPWYADFVAAWEVSHNLDGTIKAAAIADKVAKAGDTMTGLIDLGTPGDQQSIYGGGSLAPSRLRSLWGTVAAPITDPRNSIRVTQLQNVSKATRDTISGSTGADGVEYLSAIAGVAAGTTGTEVQAVGVYGGAKSASTAVGMPNDACGLYGLGRLSVGATGTGIGAFVIGRRDGDTGRANGLEVHAYNGGTATPYSSIGFQNSQGIWINAGGAADSSSAITVSNAFGRQFAVGIGFTAQVTGGLTGGARDATIRDDGNATTSILINGTHTYGLDLGGTFSTAAIRANGHVHFAPDNTYDIGASTVANRVRSIYLGTSVRVGTSTVLWPGILTLGRHAAAQGAPGANFAASYFRDGTTTGTLRLAHRAGVTGDEVTIVDDIPQTVGGQPSTPLSFNPITTTYDYDEFAAGSTTNGQVGKLGWNYAGTASILSSETGRPGIYRLATTAVIGNNAYFRSEPSSTSPYMGSDTFDLLWMVRLTQVDATTTARIGMGWFSQDPPTHGNYFERLSTDTNWFAVTRGSGVETRTDTGVAAGTGWVRMRVRRINASTLGFTLDNGTEIQHTTTIATTQMTTGIQIVTGEAVIKTIDVDWFSCRITNLNR